MSPLPRRGRRRTGKEPRDDAEPETPIAPTTGVPRRLGRRGGHARAVGSVEAQGKRANGAAPEKTSRRPYNGAYEGETLSRVAFPLGGIGAGMVCLEGTGALSHVSLRHQPEVFNEPCVFAAVCVKGEPERRARARRPGARVEALRPARTPATAPGARPTACRGSAARRFAARFPFGTVTLDGPRACPLEVEITGWSPFVPGDADSSSLPVAALEYRFTNRTARAARRPSSRSTRGTSWRVGRRPSRRCAPIPGGFVLWGGGAEGEAVGGGRLLRDGRPSPSAKVNCAWFRGGWFDPLTMVWKDVEEGACYDRPPVTEGEPSPGASLFVPFTLEPGATQDDRRCCSAWYVGRADLRIGDDPRGRRARAASGRYRPWYAGRFAGDRGGGRVLADALRRAARGDRAASRLLLRHDAAAGGGRGGGGQPHDPEVAHRAAPGGRPALGWEGCGDSRAAATAPARTSGTTPRRCRTCSRRSSGRCARPSSASSRTTRGHQTFRARAADPAARRTTSTPPPTASSAGS